jgi:hypothetical protein
MNPKEELKRYYSNRYYLYYDFGSCNDGDHCHGLEIFETVEAVEARATDLKEAYHAWNLNHMTVIHGTIVMLDGD